MSLLFSNPILIFMHIANLSLILNFLLYFYSLILYSQSLLFVLFLFLATFLTWQFFYTELLVFVHIFLLYGYPFIQLRQWSLIWKVRLRFYFICIKMKEIQSWICHNYIYRIILEYYIFFLLSFFFFKLKWWQIVSKTKVEYIIDFPNSEGQKKRQNRDSKNILNLKKVIWKHIYQPNRKYLDNYHHVVF